MKLKKKAPSKNSKKSPDEVINELITQRKVQQEALIKIKASVDKKRLKGTSHEVEKPNPKK